MTQEQIRKVLLQLELPEGAAFMRAEEDASGGKPYLAEYLFVYYLKKRLDFYDEEFAQLIKEGKIKSPETTALLEAGATPEMLADFAYELLMEAFHMVLYPISDSQSVLERIDFEREDNTEPLPSWCLAERDGEGNLTGRYLSGMHELIPY